MGSGFVVIFEINPTAHTVDIFAPFLGVFQDRSAAGVVEFIDAHFFNLGLIRHAELLHAF